MILPRAGVCDEATLEGLVDQVIDDGMQDMDPRLFYDDEVVVDPPQSW